MAADNTSLTKGRMQSQGSLSDDYYSIVGDLRVLSTISGRALIRRHSRFVSTGRLHARFSAGDFRGNYLVGLEKLDEVNNRQEPRSSHLSHAKICFQSFFMLITV